MSKKYSLSGVSLIEVMVAIMIFFIGLLSVYSVVWSTSRLNEYNKNFIIASNLAREQIEIVKNMRDYNFLKLRKWDSIVPDNSQAWEPETYYKIANSEASFLDISIEKIDNFWVGKDELTGLMWTYEMCLEAKGIYSYNCDTASKKSGFYRYLKVSEVIHSDADGNSVTIEDALKFESHVIWYKSWYHSTKISTLLTDWQRL